jgi:hypothetical protein
MSTHHTAATVSAIAARLGRLVIPDAEAEARRQRAEKGERSSRALELWARADVPRRHADRALHPCSTAPATGWVETRAQVLGMLGRGVTVCLTGTRGNGKTQIGVEAILATTLKGNSALFRTAQRMFMEFKGTFDDGAKRTELQVLESLRRPSLLVLDEIGQRTESEWENRTFFEVLNARYNDMSDTILTCNLTLQELRQNLGPSLVDRMKEGGGMVECNWPSFRSPPP